jgi:serine/threonine protein kinase
VSQFVALKILKDNSNSSKIKFLKEVDEMRKTDHPNIIKLIDCCEWKDKYDNYSCMILELADFGSLSKGI